VNSGLSDAPHPKANTGMLRRNSVCNDPSQGNKAAPGGKSSSPSRSLSPPRHMGPTIADDSYTCSVAPQPCRNPSSATYPGGQKGRRGSDARRMSVMSTASNGTSSPMRMMVGARPQRRGSITAMIEQAVEKDVAYPWLPRQQAPKGASGRRMSVTQSLSPGDMRSQSVEPFHAVEPFHGNRRASVSQSVPPGQTMSLDRLNASMSPSPERSPSKVRRGSIKYGSKKPKKYLATLPGPRAASDMR